MIVQKVKKMFSYNHYCNPIIDLGVLMEKIDQWIFSKINLSQFIFLSIFLSFAGDGVYILFLKFVLGSQENLERWMQSNSWMPNMKIILGNPELMTQMLKSFNQFLNLLIILFILLNLIGYIFFYKKKKFAVKYVKNLAFTGLVLGIFAVWEAKDHGTFWITIMALLLPLYFVVYRGIKYYFSDILSR